MKLKNLLSKIGKDYFYLMHLSYNDVPSREPLWRYAYDNNRIGLSQSEIDRDWSEVSERTRREALTDSWYRQFERFCDKMSDGDCVLVMEGMSHLLGVGIVGEPHEFKNIRKTKEYPKGFFNHVRPVRWLKKYKYENRIPFKTTFENTIAYVDSSSPRWGLINRELDMTGIGSTRVRKIEKDRKVSVLRKYGPHGEGEDHKKLKEWVKKHPKHIGLKNVTHSADEQGFISGDRVDIYFKCRPNTYAVVEIETSNPSPGVFQALKYKVLLCAELGWDIKSPDVKAILVANSPLTKEDEKLCEKYGIKFYRVRNATCTKRI